MKNVLDTWEKISIYTAGGRLKIDNNTIYLPEAMKIITCSYN